MGARAGRRFLLSPTRPITRKIDPFFYLEVGDASTATISAPVGGFFTANQNGEAATATVTAPTGVYSQGYQGVVATSSVTAPTGDFFIATQYGDVSTASAAAPAGLLTTYTGAASAGTLAAPAGSLSFVYHALGLAATSTISGHPGDITIPQVDGTVSTFSIHAHEGGLHIVQPVFGNVANVTLTAETGAKAGGYWFEGETAFLVLSAPKGERATVTGVPATMTITGIDSPTSYGPIVIVQEEDDWGDPWGTVPWDSWMWIETPSPPGYISGMPVKALAAELTSGSGLTQPVGFYADSDFIADLSVYLYAEQDLPLDLSMRGHGDFDIRIAPNLPDFMKVRARTVLTVEVATAIPAIIEGRPYNPYWWAKPQKVVTVAGKAKRIPRPPEPILTFPPVPSSGCSPGGKYTWKAEDIGSSQVSVWPETNGGPSWYSSGVWRPNAGARGVFRRGTEYIHTAGVHFHYDNLEHMWMDLGCSTNTMTWVIAAIVFDYPTRKYGHYLLDSGKPTPAGTTDYTWRSLNEASLGYRNLMLLQRRDAIMCSRRVVEDGVFVRPKHNFVGQPRVYAGVFNGAQSRFQILGRGVNWVKTGTLDRKSHRYFVTGRRHNARSKMLGAHFVLFEMRFFNGALSQSQILDQYRNLASYYKFNKYRR